MNYTIKGKKIRIPDETIKKYIKAFELTEAEAINMYLEEEGVIDNIEIDKLTEQAKENKTAKMYVSTEKKRQNTNRQPKEDIQKEGIIKDLETYLKNKGYQNITIVNKTKLITFEMGNNSFKLDLIRTNLKLQEKKKNKGGI